MLDVSILIAGLPMLMCIGVSLIKQVDSSNVRAPRPIPKGNPSLAFSPTPCKKNLPTTCCATYSDVG